jgi:hypothetical protein
MHVTFPGYTRFPHSRGTQHLSRHLFLFENFKTGAGTHILAVHEMGLLYYVRYVERVLALADTQLTIDHDTSYFAIVAAFAFVTLSLGMLCCTTFVLI